jgi:hypothetical protein
MNVDYRLVAELEIDDVDFSELLADIREKLKDSGVTWFEVVTSRCGKEATGTLDIKFYVHKSEARIFYFS